MNKIFLKLSLSITIFTIMIPCFAVYIENSRQEKYSVASKIFVTDFNNKRYTKIWKRASEQFKNKVSKLDLDIYISSYRDALGKIKYIDEPILTKNFAVTKIFFKKYIYYLLMNLDHNEKYTLISFTPTLANLPEPIFPKVTSHTTIDKLAEAYLHLKATSGLAIGIINQGKPETYYYGTTEKKKSTKPDKNTEFELGDLTKVFTAAALLEMEVKQIISPSTSINKFLPTSAQTKNCKKTITLNQLLTHTSGFPLVPENLIMTMTNMANPYSNYSTSKLYNFLQNYNPSEISKNKYSYSSLGYGLIGHIMTLKTGLSYPEIINNEICIKLGMKNTTTVLSTDQKLNLAQGYTINGTPAEIWKNSVLSGAYALKSTLHDMMLFLSENLSPKDDALGKSIKNSHKIIFKSKDGEHVQTYGGWEILRFNDAEIFLKCGATGGFSCGMAFFKDFNSGVIVLSNSAINTSELIVKLLEYLAVKLELTDDSSYYTPPVQS